MRISSARIGTVAGLFGAGCLVLALSGYDGGLAPERALAFDGTTSPATASLSPSDGFRAGAHAPEAIKPNALTALSMRPIRASRWRNGSLAVCTPTVTACRGRSARLQLFQPDRQRPSGRGPGTPQARFVANAFVALGHYYLDGIPNSKIEADPDRAREMFDYAACYFGDADAQYRWAGFISRHAERSASGGAVVPSSCDQGPLPRRSGARRYAVPRPSRAAAGRARPDVAHARQGLRRQRRMGQAALR